MPSSIVSGNAVVFTTSTGAATVTATPTWSLGSGSNRGVVLDFSHEQQAANRTASAISVGGVSFTKIVGGQNGTGSSYANAEIWACNEASALSIGSNPTISITWANPSGTAANNYQAQGVIVTVQDVNQDLSTWTNTDTDSQLATSALAGDLTGFSAGSLILGGYCDQTGGVSVNCAQTGGDATTEFTSSDVNFNGSNARAVQFYATAASTTPAIRVQRNTTSGSVYQALAIVGVPDYSSPSATISSGTPSGTIGTGRRATLGCTSTISSGTIYSVLSSTQGDITGITDAQVYAAQYSGGGAASISGNNTVSDLTPDILITGLSPSTTYYYALMHRVGTNNSNVLTGSFTTAVATSTASLTLRDSGGTLLNAQTLNFWTRTGLNTVAVDGGTNGLSVTCNASGVFTFSGLSIDAGAGFITVRNPIDNTFSANYPVTFVAGD